jgi:hypothetical protein
VSAAIRRTAKIAFLPLFHGGNTGSNPVGDANCRAWELLLGVATRTVPVLMAH